MSAHPLPSILATVDVGAKMGISQDLSYQSVGMAIVLLALATIALVLFLLGKVFQSTVPAKKAPALQPALAATNSAPGTAPADAVISPETFAVIAAAVYLELPGMSRIVEIRQSPTAQVWSMEGRRQIFQSHRVR